MIRHTAKITTLAVALLGATATGVFAQGAPSPDRQAPMLTTTQFVHAAAQSDEFEAQEGRLAQSQSNNSEIKAYGQKMITDHGRTTAELKAAIAKNGMSPPPPATLTAEQYKMLGELKALNGKAFDEEYTKQAVVSHREALGLHEEYNLKGDNAAIKLASMEATPIIKEHLRLANNMVLMMRPPQL